ncbi:DUF1993 family protein [uncultured Algimonas sp.]|uniref:DUF1993 domain-containing protein n=1 Tax=uncultured Algimonas sp. TaxID=1547920 RepID=UPI002625D008|nr:DUF1993 domain-containing protein [uncultured Algimonas sp.]
MTDAYALLVPTYRNMLKALSAWLDKADQESPTETAQAHLSARLIDDMLPLSSQIAFACLQAQEPVHRLRNEALPSHLEVLAETGRNAGDRPGTLQEAQKRIGNAVAFLDTLSPDALALRDDFTVTLDLPNGMTFDLSGPDYVRDWALPQFYFHLNTAYAILRKEGVELGKADYVPHMFAYLRS